MLFLCRGFYSRADKVKGSAERKPGIQGLNAFLAKAKLTIDDERFNSFLTLPLQLIAQLRFPYEGIAEVILGDGDTLRLDSFAATVLWDGDVRTGLVLAADGAPLVGMDLLLGSRVCLAVITGGSVSIERLP